jgi:hypothetical protein
MGNARYETFRIRFETTCEDGTTTTIVYLDPLFRESDRSPQRCRRLSTHPPTRQGLRKYPSLGEYEDPKLSGSDERSIRGR